ncbi:unnamed protein product [Adineta steineri]|uniref:GT23 domain-containing protein n=1 Tax=Adineta steineri TaxID=433720 RepID=A0A818PUR9_9BILA|nr:unnamed protein product [Adineta steineri]
MPMAIPEDLSERLIRLHGNPFVWFTGQLMKYLLRPQAWLTQFLEEKYNTLQFETPIVGIHVRRTDKVGTEAAFHDISEYMKYVEDYYIIYKYQNPNINVSKRVYIATDEPLVFDDARTKYPDYIFYGDKSVAKSAQVNSRYGTESLKGVLSDVHFLSLCDYLVCTFSSQICRIAYETMQQRTIDGAWRAQSLDDVYYFGGQHDHQQRAFISHKAVKSKEFSFERGAIISAEGNHWNGFSKGSDKANNQSGLYPSYKTEEIVRIAQMYHYSEINPITGSVQHSPTGLTDACYHKADSHFVTCAQNGDIYVFDRNLDLVKRIRCDGSCHCIAVHKRYLFVGTKTNELEVRSFPGEKQIELQRRIQHSNLTDASRLAILKALDDYVQTLKEEGRKQLLILTQDRSKYKTILANLTAQGLFLLMEKDVTIRCRRNDRDLIKELIPDATNKLK